MLFHNALDFMRKLRLHYERTKTPGGRLRMSLSMRIQHGVLALSFIALAYSGFALKYPQAWWAAPFSGHPEWRSNCHRVAAVLFTLLSVYHVFFLAFSRRGRDELRAILPARADLVQPFQMLAFYLGWRKERPKFARYSYIEKAEYWALVWGSTIMIVTGGFLLWEAWTLRHFPKWAFDVFETVHFYEAILACLAILVWHMYFVIFDPDEYPMKWTWMSGEDSPADKHHRKQESGP
jgi:formate dehydrogenase gamma subunit